MASILSRSACRSSIRSNACHLCPDLFVCTNCALPLDRCQDIFGNFIKQALAAGVSPPERLDEAFITLAPLHLRHSLIFIGQRRRYRQPEPSVLQKRLARLKELHKTLEIRQQNPTRLDLSSLFKRSRYENEA